MQPIMRWEVTNRQGHKMLDLKAKDTT